MDGISLGFTAKIWCRVRPAAGIGVAVRIGAGDTAGLAEISRELRWQGVHSIWQGQRRTAPVR